MKHYIRQVQQKRKNAKKTSKIDTNEPYSPRNPENQIHKGDRNAYLDALRKGLSVKSYYDSRDVDAMSNIIDNALEQKYITERQADIFRKRLDKISTEAKAPSKEELEKEAKDEEGFKEKTGFGEKTVENLKKSEIGKNDLEEERDEIIQNAEELGKEIKEKFGGKEEDDLTSEEKKEYKALQQKIQSLSKRTAEVQMQLSNYTKEEVDINEAHTVLDEDWFYKDGKIGLLEESLSDDEKKILGFKVDGKC
jgi:hypothetical protein